VRKILILGAAGNISSRVTANLARKSDVSLRLTSSRDEGVQHLRDTYPDAECIKADWYDRDSLVKAFDGVESILVIPPDFSTDETVVTPNIIAAAQANDSVEMIVRILSQSPKQTVENMDPEWLATRCGSGLHPVAQHLLAETDLPVTFVNVGAWIGFNLEWFMAPDIRNLGTLRLPSDAVRPWLDEVDIADAFTAILAGGPNLHARKSYVLTATDRYTFAQVANVIGDEIGAPIKYEESAAGLKESMDDIAEQLITYFGHEAHIWDEIPPSEDLVRLIGRPANPFANYVRQHREIFLR
jgi:NAD(P)H dehydrogenase (quinone)